MGTVVTDAHSGETLHDFTTPLERVMIAQGGRGGHGNSYFASSTNRTPQKAQDGRPGEEKLLRLELKLLADVGLVGLPKCGKIHADFPYLRGPAKDRRHTPFTTLEPHLGVPSPSMPIEPSVKSPIFPV